MATPPPPPTGLPAASITHWTGLYRSVDPFAIAPGAMAIADNVVVSDPSVLGPRRGFKGVTASADWAALGNFGQYLMAFTASDTPVGTPSALFRVDVKNDASAQVSRAASSFSLIPAMLSAYGQLSALTSKTRFLNANGSLYQSTNFGLARVESPTGTWAPAGMDTPIIQSTFSLQVGTMLPTGSQVAYRCTYLYTDTNGIQHRSPPSTRVLVVNTSGGTRDVLVEVKQSSMVLPGTIIEVWRTFTIANPTVGDDAAGDEMFKITESPLAYSTVGSNGFVADPSFGTIDFLSYVDSTPDVPFLNAPLYTNPTTGDVNGLGIGNQDTPPPASADAFSFKGRTYFCNTEEAQTLTLQIIGTGAGGIVDGDTFTLGGANFMWRDNAGGVSGGYFKVVLYRSGGTFDLGSVIANIRASSFSLATAINSALGPLNSTASSGIPYAALETQIRAETQQIASLPGYVHLRRLMPGFSAFSIAAGIGAGRGWAGALVTDNASDSNRQPANLMQSQPSDPESVPDAFTNTVGQLELPILRGIPLRDYAYLFKAGSDGLWKFSDDGTGSLTIGPLDQTVHLIAPETAVTLENTIFALCDKGVLRIADGGAPENVSINRIDNDLAALISRVGPDTLARLAFGVAYESEGLYVLCLPEAANSTAATVQYTYSLLTDAWTRWTLPVLGCGLVAAGSDLLTFGLRPHGTSLPSGKTLWSERKALDDSDFQDPPVLGLTVPGAGTYAASTLTFSGDKTGTFVAGDLISYTSGAVSTLDRVLSVTYSVGGGTTAVVLENSATWTAGEAFTLIKGIQSSITLLPLVAGDVRETVAKPVRLPPQHHRRSLLDLFLDRETSYPSGLPARRAD